MQNLFVRALVTYMLSALGLVASGQVPEENNAPIVEITKPKTHETFNWNTLVPYAITVKDREDGNSAYEEITERQVILIVKYLDDPSLVDDYIKRINQDLPPLIAMSKSTCLNCHAANSKLIGPSFDLIAKKYSTHDNAKAYLTEKIISGSTGVWGEEKMPPHPNLNKKELGQIMDWILKQKDNPTQFYLGLEGAIRIKTVPASSTNQVCIMTAAYQDQGLTSTQKDQKLGCQTIKLKVRH